MTSRRAFLCIAAIGFFLMTGAISASAGGRSIFTGPVNVEALETYGCPVVNLSSRTLTNVRSVVRGFDGGELRTTTCAERAPLEVCGSVGATGLTPGLVYCEITSDQGAKGLRGTLTNVATGASSDAR